MQKDLTYIAVLLDRSGSMHGTETDVVGGANAFIEQQRAVPGDAIITIARFDDTYETIYEDVDIKSARLLTPEDFVPRGNTALFDAMNRLLTHVGAKLAALPEDKRPGQVFFLVFSDGQENHSSEVRDGQVIRDMVKRQEEVYSWKFLFFGMEIDAVAVGGSIGVKGLSSSKTSGGIGRSAKAASAYVGTSRMGNTKAAEEIYGSVDVDDVGVSHGIADFEASLDAKKNGKDKKN